jgi:hypothetical protein
LEEVGKLNRSLFLTSAFEKPRIYRNFSNAAGFKINAAARRKILPLPSLI